MSTKAKRAPKKTDEATPIIQQYRAAKQQHPGMLLLFRVGDFHEMFDTDAKLAARVLGIVVTTRDAMPMAGFPHHQLENHLKKLFAAGHRVAICEPVKGELLPTVKPAPTPPSKRLKVICNVCGQPMQRNLRGGQTWHCTNTDLPMGHKGLVPDSMVYRWRQTGSVSRMFRALRHVKLAGLERRHVEKLTIIKV